MTTGVLQFDPIRLPPACEALREEARAFLNEEIAAGTFDSKSLDGRNGNRLQFEGAIIRSLISSDPAAASARLAIFPADQRSEVFQHFGWQPLKEADHATFANLVRSQLPEDQQAAMLASQASQLSNNGDYGKVGEFMDRIQATPAERSACVTEVATSQISSLSHQREITIEDLDSMREWVGAQDPAQMEQTTGLSIANAIRGDKTDFADASELVLHYRQSSGSDEILVSFLEHVPTWQNKEEARKLAEVIADEESRTKILKRFD